MISLEREWDFFVHLQSWRESWAILFSVKNGTYFVYIAMMLKCVHANVKNRFNEKRWKIWRSINFFLHLREVKLCLICAMCIITWGQYFLNEFRGRRMEFWKIEMNAINALHTHTHTLADTLQYAVQSKWICVCEQGDELQTLCVSLLWLFNFALQKALHPQLLLQQCGQSNWKHEQHIYCITQMYTDEMLP